MATIESNRRHMYKICRITDAYPPPWSGLGPGPHALSSAQAELGNEVHVITKYREGCEELDQAGLPYVHRIKGKSLFFEMMAIRKMLSLDKVHRFDLIHTHGASFFLFHLLYGRSFQRPVGVSIHSLRKKQFNLYGNAKIKKKFLRERWLLFREKVALDNCDFFFPVSNGLKEELIQFYKIGEELIEIPGNGAEPFFLRPEEDAKINQMRETWCLGSSNVLLFVGTLNGRKDVGQIIKAVEIFKKEGVKVKLIVIGSGSLKNHYESQAAQLGVEEDVMFIGQVSQKELSCFYQLSDMFVFPSFYEGLPKVVIEAMASGLPVVCSDIPGNNQLVTHGVNGYLSDINDHHAFEQNILSLIKNPVEAKKMGLRGKSFIETEYTWNAVAKRYQDAYSKMVIN